jgi:hypothetical protein
MPLVCERKCKIPTVGEVGAKNSNVPAYTEPEQKVGGSSGAFTKLVPALRVIDPIIYHTFSIRPIWLPQGNAQLECTQKLKDVRPS